MKIILWAVTTCVLACACADRGGSLRGALEALQRRQRGRQHGAAPPDYEALYEFVPPQGYPEPDYDVDIENIDDEPTPKYIIKLLNENQRVPNTYEYKVIKKNNELNGFDSADKKSSAFRERSQHADNDRLRDLFMDKNDAEEKDNVSQDKEENDAEYAILLGQLWSKYKNNKAHINSIDNAPQGVVKLFKEKVVKKRYSDNWGPIAFKRKRSPDSESEKPGTGYDGSKNHLKELNQNNLKYNSYEVSDNDKNDMREEYAIAFQPLDDDSLSDLADEDQYAYDTIEKRFPVAKRSSGPYDIGIQKKRYALDQNKHYKAKTFRSSTGTDPKLIQDLSKIFGNSELGLIKNHVKRSSDHAKSMDSIPPNLTVIIHNHTKTQYNETENEDSNHEHHEYNIHPPGVTGNEVAHNHKKRDHGHDSRRHIDIVPRDQDKQEEETEKPIILNKKSIDWSDYFGIDKRFKKPSSFINNPSEDLLKKQYFDTFNKEVIYPISPLKNHSFTKRTFAQTVPARELEFTGNFLNEKRSTESDNESKLDTIDKKLKNMEGLIVGEALHYTNIGEELDSKDEQAMKEKLLSRLAAAYSLEKMRKALKEFKQSLHIQKVHPTSRSQPEPTDMKDKRVAVKKEKVLMSNNIPIYRNDEEKSHDFEDEQGAGHYLNGKGEEQLSEGYMGGSGRHRVPVISTASSSGACPVLAKIIQRCRGVDVLSGDRGQLFLPLCSLHQICYLCGEAPLTTCDLVFLSEADSTCEGDMRCQRTARSALMALRELHDNLADELDGECETSPCLPATLKLNLGWQRALQR